MSGVHAVSPAPRVSTSAARRGAKRRKPVRPPQPQTPVDFFSSEAYALLVDLLAGRAQRWLADRLPPLYFYPRDSVPLWGDYAQHRCSSTTLRAVGRRLLCESLCVDLERGLRLLTLPWTAQGKTADGHNPEEWRLSLAGVLWRVGQLYRELARRKGEEGAREIVRLAMETLWQ